MAKGKTVKRKTVKGKTGLVVLFTLSVIAAASSIEAQTPPATPAQTGAAAQELFVDLGPAALAALLEQPRAGSAAIVDRRAVGMRLDRLFASGGPVSRVRLNVAEQTWIAQFERIEQDSTGFRSWVGALEGVEYSHVVFTERDGIVAGLINAVATTYQLRTAAAGTYLLERVDTSAMPAESEPLLAPPGPVDTGRVPSMVAADDGATIDVLMLYTPAARAAAGGAAQIQAIASQIIADSNTIYGRSGITTRLRLAGTSEFAHTEASRMGPDLDAVTSSATVRALRDATRADIVQLLVNSPDRTSCGIAFLLNSLANNSFTPLSVSHIACVAQYTPTHEIGHNLGSHHAPEDGASTGLFSYSYGFKDPARGFRTVMAYACSSGPACVRVANMSNPSVAHNGGPTGSGAQNNALSINNAAFTAANWRQAAPTTLTAPATPTGLRSQVSGSTVTLAWDAAADRSAWAASAASAYTLQVGTTPGVYGVFNASIGNTTSVSGIVPAGAYVWRLSASNSAGSSAPSAESQFVVTGTACVVPGPPQNFTFSLSGRTVTLNWVVPATGTAPTGYTIEAGSATGLANLYNAATGSAAPGAVAQAPPGSYFVRIRAQNACGTGAASTERIITVP